MKIVFIFTSLLFASIVQAFLFRLGFFGTVEPPLLLLTVFYWLWRMPFGERIFFATLVSLFFESMSIFPPGSYFVVLLSLASCTGALRSFFVNAKPHVIQGITAFVSLFFAAVFMGVYSFLADRVYGIETEFGMQWILFLFWSLGWAFIYSLVTYIRDLLHHNAAFQQKTIHQSFS